MADLVDFGLLRHIGRVQEQDWVDLDEPDPDEKPKSPTKTRSPTCRTAVE